MRVGSNCRSRIIVWAVIGCMVAACAQGTPLSTIGQPTPVVALPADTPGIPLSATYSSDLFGISFEYPAGWQKKPGNLERYEGVTGFFQIDGLMYSEIWTIDDVALAKGDERIMPYIRPIRIDRLEIQGQEARLIRPGADWLGDVAGQAGLLVALPRRPGSGQESYNYLLLWTNEEYVDQIVQTWKFW